ncbi:hypothetical protein [Scytonema sp. PCC 10023]|uniref:hypothetical protein n=1 Tax=Scytonema sp. PCC 10023 TaxID=1680591 RepID=UPI0039C6CEBB
MTASTQGAKDKELQAFKNSQYNYWDARVLADYWGQSEEDAKARIGRKILWGKKDTVSTGARFE